MSVYVDRACVPYRGMLMCRLFADTPAELHAFAEMLGLKRAWYHTGTVLPHYDVSLTKRAEAIRRGAIPVDRRWIKRRIREKREREARRKQLSLPLTTRPRQERAA